MNTSICRATQRFSPTSIKTAVVRFLVAALVLMLAQAALVSPAAAACTFPVDVATEAELNAAISCYNGTTAAGAYTITLTQNINLTASTTAIDNATSGVSLTIEGGGFAVNGQDIAGVRPFDIAASTNVTMRQLTVTRGRITAIAEVGGGIRNSGTLTIIDSTISNNQTEIFGGGIGNESGGNLTVRNSTISGNSNNAAGGGILNKGQLTLDSVTMTGNYTGNSGALQVDGSGAVAIIQNSILANTSTSGGPGRDCETVNGGTVTDGGHNLVEVQKDCGFVNGANGNIVGVDPVLGRLANNGGPTQTAALLPGSPAIDAGSTTLTADQRGIARPQGATADIGAFESRGFSLAYSAGSPQGTPLNEVFANPLVVRVTSAFNEPVGGGQVTFTAPGSGASLATTPLAATISSNSASQPVTANGVGGSYTVNADMRGNLGGPVPFNLTNLTCVDSASVSTHEELKNAIACFNFRTATVTPYTITLTKNISLSGATTSINNANSGVALVLDGAGFALDGGGLEATRPIDVRPNTVVTIRNLTVQNAKAPVGNSNGGAILNAGTLTIEGSTISGNQAENGAGIYSSGQMEIRNSTISGNTAYIGGGIFNLNRADVDNSTIAGNRADRFGGGVWSQDSPFFITNSTVRLNFANSAGGGLYGTLTLKNTIVIDNSSTFTPSGADLMGNRGQNDVHTSQGYNMIGTFYPLLDDPLRPQPTDIIGQTSLMSPLGDYGGATQTMALLPNSPAINAGDPACPATDQRGVARVGNCDIGAFESRGFVLSATGGSGQGTRINTAFAAPLVATVSSAFAEPVDGGQVIFTAPGSGASLATTPLTTTIGGGSASQPVSANGTEGRYAVNADTRGNLGSPVGFDLRNWITPPTYSVTAQVGTGSGIVICTPSSVSPGGDSTCAATPATGFLVQSWSGDCVAAGSQAQCTLTNIQSDKRSTVDFVAKPPSTFSVSATVGGSVPGSVTCTPSLVKAGGKSQCTAVPGPGDQVDAWTGDCAGTGSNVQCRLSNITSDQSSTVSFKALPLGSYHVSASVVGGNGSVSCTPTTVAKGESSTCTAVPDAGYQVQSWTGACATWGSQDQCYLPKIRADQLSTVSFMPIPPATYSVSATVSAGNGHVSCTPTSVSAGGASSCTAVPDAGWQIDSWSGACTAAGNTDQCDLTNIQADQVSAVSFTQLPLPTYSLSASVDGGNGLVNCAPPTVPQGDSGSCTATPDPGYQVASWSGACASAGTNIDCALSNVQADQVSTVRFAPIPLNQYHVSAKVVLGHGTVDCQPTTVAAGGASTCTATPEAGYQVANWGGDCAGWGTQTQCYLTKIKADKTATVSFAPLPPTSYSVSATVSAGNGQVSCTPSPVTAGDSSSCTAVPDAGWEIQSWGGACAGTGTSTLCSLTNIQANQNATVAFVAQALPSYSVSATVDGGNGTVSCAPTTVVQGDSAHCTATPDTGYQVASWSGDCAATGTNVDCFLGNIQRDQSSTVRFAPLPPAHYSITATVTSGHGAVSCTPPSVLDGGSSTCTAVPDPGYRVQAWGGDCAFAGSQSQCQLSPIRADQVATVSFLHVLPGSYQVSATVTGGNGTVDCVPTTVAKGASSTCTATPDAGYQVAAWGGDCASAGSATQCYLPKIQKNQDATVSFAARTANTFHVSARVDGGHGRVSCTPETVAPGSDSTCTALPDAGYQVAYWDGACLLAGQNPICRLTNIQADQTSTVSFALLSLTTYSVTASVSEGQGTVSCTPASVSAGGASTCTAVPGPDYRVGGWSGACAFAGNSPQCVLTNVQGNQVSAVRFVSNAPTNPNSIPTLSEWGLILLSLMMLGAAQARLRG